MGFEDRDGKFVKEFQTTFNSSFWELYLFACLRDGLSCKVDAAGNLTCFNSNAEDNGTVVFAFVFAEHL